MLTFLIILAAVIVLAAFAVGFWAVVSDIMGGHPVVATGAGLFCAVMAALVVGWLPASYAFAHNDRTLTCTVTDKDRGGDEGSYRVYTEECGQLANEDSMWRGKYDSADVWQDLKVGETYKLHVVGYRIPFLSQFPNVLSVEGEA